MKTRWLVIVFAVVVVAAVAAAVWLSLPVDRTQSLLGEVFTGRTPAGPVSDDWFADLVSTDPIVALHLSARAYDESAAGGFTAEFRKRERMNGKLADEEVIRVAVRDDPYSALMLWQEGGGAGQGTLYIRGQNGGKMKVWMFRKLVQDVDPQGFVPKQSARYTIEEFGIRQATQRTLRAWAAAEDADAARLAVGGGPLACVVKPGDRQFRYEYLGRKVVPETGGRECFVLKRTCPADQIDPFVTGGPAVEVTDKNRRDSFRFVTVYLDCETRVQVGTEQHRHDGELTASYFFRDVNLKPTFDADTFTTKSFK